MTALDVRAVEELAGALVSYAYAVKAGPWVFLTGHEAYDWQPAAPKAWCDATVVKSLHWRRSIAGL